MTPEDDAEERRAVIDDLMYHQARILLLVHAVAAEPGHNRKLDGLTKLAKLDFLVRYPALAGQVLDGLGLNDDRMHVGHYELSAPTEVDDPMIRYKYGPWDDRYYPVVGALVARGLVRYLRGRRGSVALSTTASGDALADRLASDPLWLDVSERCIAIAQASVGMTGNAIKERIYDRLGHLMDRPHREVIT